MPPVAIQPPAGRQVLRVEGLLPVAEVPAGGPDPDPSAPLVHSGETIRSASLTIWQA